MLDLSLIDLELVGIYKYYCQADILLNFRVKTLKCFIYMKHSIRLIEILFLSTFKL